VNNDEKDFRGFHWGVTFNEIKEREASRLVSEDDQQLVYDGILGNWQVQIAYDFVAGQLAQGSYSLLETHSNRNDFITTFDRIKELLIKKYGKPIDEAIWKNNLYRDDPQEWGLAISIGHLNFRAKWNLVNTEIILFLTGENYELANYIFYYSKELSGKLKEVDNNKIINDL